MARVPATFRPLHDGWLLTPVDLAAGAPEGVRGGVPASVPGEVHLDLRAAAVIGDPFDGDNEAAQQWIGDTSWCWETTFDWEPGEASRHDLVAYGLDTVTTVELNGIEVARTQNMHRSYRWDVRELLRPGANTLRVTVAAPVPEAAARAKRDGALPHANHHEFNQVRKMASSFGWDWGIDVAGAGIWKPIGIDSWATIRVDSVRPLVDVGATPNGHDGLLTAYVDIERDGVGPDEAVPIVVVVTPPGSREEIIGTGTVPAGSTSTAVEVAVPDVLRWWPVGHGEQPLYAVTVVAEGAAGAWTGRVGFRTVAVDQRPDAEGTSFVLLVNGDPVQVRGMNWIPDHAFLTEIDKDRYARRVTDALDAHVNLLRVWGGGIYESDDLYDLADESGLLMWQDFLFACAAYPEDDVTRAEVEAEARENITRLSPHPSLVIWNGNNENTWGSVDWGWQAVLDGRPWGDGYYRELLPAVLAEQDPTRYYSVASPYSFGDYLHPNDLRHGTSHLWEVWNRLDYSTYASYRPRFVSEFGFQGPPAWSTLTRVVHDVPLDPFGPQMLVHQKAARGNEKLQRGWAGHLPQPATVEDWHWTTQLNQAHAIRFGIEHFRSLAPLCAGTILWQLNDNWPVVSWSAVDFDEHRKPLWYAVRATYAPRLATFQPRPSEHARATAWEGAEPELDTVALVLLNDTPQPFDGSFTIARQAFDGTVLVEVTLDVAVPSRGQTTVTVPAKVASYGDASRELLVAAPSPPAGGVDSSGFAPAFHNGAELVDQALDPMPLKVEARRTPDGHELTVTAISYARDVFCHADIVDPAARVDDGLITLAAGQSATLRVTSGSAAEPEAFVAALRCANDLLADHPTAAPPSSSTRDRKRAR